MQVGAQDFGALGAVDEQTRILRREVHPFWIHQADSAKDLHLRHLHLLASMAALFLLSPI